MAADERYTTESRVADLLSTGPGESVNDMVEPALNAAHRFVDRSCGRHFDKRASTRLLFAPQRRRTWLRIGDSAIVPTLVEVRVGTRPSSPWQPLTDDDWAVRIPQESWKPYRTLLRVDDLWPQSYAVTMVAVTTEPGFAEVPADISFATDLLALRYVTRPKHKVMQISAEGEIMRADPDIMGILKGHTLDRNPVR